MSRFCGKRVKSKDMQAWLQVVLAAVALLVLITISARIVRQEALVDSGLVPVRQQDALLVRPPQRSQTVIGTTAFTHPSKAEAIYDLLPSRNRQGGDQLSLSFRLKLVNSEEPVNRCILLWGDKNRVDVKPVDPNHSSMQHLWTFMPMIWMSTRETNTPDEKYKLHVYFNCVNKIFNVCEGYINNRTVDLVNNGAIITVTFTDYAVNLVSKGCMCNMYVETTPVATTKVPGDNIRRNIGLMYILPGTETVPGINDQVRPRDEAGSLSNVQISDLSYHNYELGVSEMNRKMRGTLRYTEDKKIDEGSGAYDASEDLTYHNLVTPVYNA